jgi:hypothetical protein
LEETSEIASVIAVKHFTPRHIFRLLCSRRLRCLWREDRGEQIGPLRDALELRESLATVVVQGHFAEELGVEPLTVSAKQPMYWFIFDL